MDLQLAGKRALVLRASGGPGDAVAHSLATQGAHVIGASRKALAGGPEWLPLGLADRASIGALYDRLLPQDVGILVNNSVDPPQGPSTHACSTCMLSHPGRLWTWARGGAG
jgi:3-oxoacyl-[acyl-carrier protein] reductase